MSMKLVILGLLLEGDKHPYEVQHIMKERQMDCYIKYAKGSLYYAFEQLEKQGAIRITTIVRDTNRPDKTIFHITEEGKQLFHTLLLKQFEAKNQIYKPIYSALSFAHFGDDQELIPILEKRKMIPFNIYIKCKLFMIVAKDTFHVHNYIFYKALLNILQLNCNG